MQERDIKIDIFKGLLVLGMIYCHVLQFFCNLSVDHSAQIITSVINIITFSGFIFCFGYSTRIAYLSKEFMKVYPRILNTAFKTLIAFYISGIGFRVLVDKRPLNFETAIKVITLTDIPGWSEFLISFTLYILLAAVLFKPIKLLLENKLVFWTIFGLLFLTTLIPYEMIQMPQIGLLIGTKRFAAFPVLQYMPFYLLGMYFQKYKIGFDFKFLTGAFVFTGAAVINMVQHGGELPGRFPPTAFWLFLSMLLLYLYFLVSIRLARINAVVGILQPIGSNTMTYILLSNLFIFALAGFRSIDSLNTVQGGLFAFLLIVIIGYFVGITRRSEIRTFQGKSISLRN